MRPAIAALAEIVSDIAQANPAIAKALDNIFPVHVELIPAHAGIVCSGHSDDSRAR
jgi:hypothetical protein